MEKVNELIIGILRDVLQPSNNIELVTKIHDLGIDSILIISIIVEIENKFSIEIDYENLDFNKYVTVNDIFDIVRKQLEKKSYSEIVGVEL